jgi:hypothetical protein
MRRSALHDRSGSPISQRNAMNDQPNLTQRLEELAHRMALKQLGDTLSIPADRRETRQQTLLFTEDGTSETYVNGQLVSSLRGRQRYRLIFPSQ